MTTLDPTSPEHLRALLTHVLTDPEAFAVLAQGQPVWEGAAGIACKGCGRNTVSLARTWKLVDHACEACGHRWIAWENAEAEAQYAEGITAAVQETIPAENGVDGSVVLAPLTTRKLVGFTRLAPTTTHTSAAEKLNALLAAGHTLDGDLAGPVTYLKADTTYMVKATATPSLDRDVDAQWAIIVDVLKKEYGYLVVTDELQKKMAASIVVALTDSTLVDVTQRRYPLMPRLSKRYAVGDGIPGGTIDHYAGQESSAGD